jgi:hypothetical protein
VTVKVKMAIESVLNDEDQSVAGRVERIAEIVDVSFTEAITKGMSICEILDAVGLVIVSQKEPICR